MYSNIAVPLGAIGMGAKSPVWTYTSRVNQAVKSYGYDWLHVGLASGLTVMGALLVYYKMRERSLLSTMRAKDRMVAKYIMQVGCSPSSVGCMGPLGHVCVLLRICIQMEGCTMQVPHVTCIVCMDAWGHLLTCRWWCIGAHGSECMWCRACAHRSLQSHAGVSLWPNECHSVVRASSLKPCT